VIATDLVAALPVTCTERHSTAAAHATATVAHVAVVSAMVRRLATHHLGWTVAAAVAITAGATRTTNLLMAAAAASTHSRE
jgi:hypothetical protein